MSLDKYIGLSLGLGLSFLSISGLTALNKKCSLQNNQCSQKSACSTLNMKLGLSSMGIGGGLIVCKYILN